MLDGKYDFASPKDWCVKYSTFKKDIHVNVDQLLAADKIDELPQLGIIAFPYLVDLYESGNTDLEPILSSMVSKIKIAEQKIDSTNYQAMAKEVKKVLALE